MQNKFGLKDFVLIVLVGIVGILVVMSQFQDDRRWKQNESLIDKTNSLEQQLARIESKLDSGVTIGASSARPERGADDSSTADAGWARPGVPIEWQAPWTVVDSPLNDDGFRLGGVFTEVFEAQPSKITPILAEDTYGRRVQDQICETLAAFHPETLEISGVLADAWQYDPDGMWLRVHLRPNIRFSDGEPVDSEDVRWTFHDFINNPELETESIRSILTQIDRVEVIDDRTVEFHFVEADAYNLQAAMIYPILPKHYYTQFTNAQINQSTGLALGSGPFKLASLDPDDQWSPGENIDLVRNEQYWGQKPALDGLRFYAIDNDIARLVAFQNGETDMILPSSPQFAEMTRREGWDEQSQSLKWINMRSGYSFIGWQTGKRGDRLTPFHDKRVRQAMTMLIDRELLIRDVYEGIGEVAVGPNNPPSPAANPEIQPWPYDPDRSRELLAEAGWVDRDGDGILENADGDEFEFEFTRASGGQTIERIQKYMIDQCASVGIRCVPKIVDWSQYDQILKTRDFDSIIMGWSASAPESDPKQIWHPDSMQNQGHNFVQWDAGQGPILDRIKTTLDFEERMAHFHEFHALVHEEQPYTFMLVRPWLRFVSTDFGNVNTYPKGLEQREFYFAP